MEHAPAGVTQHGKPLDLSNGKWIPIFLQAVGESQIRREGYLVSIVANGDVACKACGCYYPALDCHAGDHFTFHLRQLDRYLAKQQEGKRAENAEGYYPAPCTSCGNPIPRSGKPGRPPTECDTCKYPLAAPKSVEEAVELDSEVWG